MNNTNQIRDFLHQPLVEGDYIVRMGDVDRSAEFGMVLHQVTGFSKGRVVTRRLCVTYNWTDVSGRHLKQVETEVKHSISHIIKSRTIVKVNPHENQIKVFEHPLDYPELVGDWLHGQKVIDWSAV